MYKRADLCEIVLYIPTPQYTYAFSSTSLKWKHVEVIHCLAVSVKHQGKTWNNSDQGKAGNYFISPTCQGKSGNFYHIMLQIKHIAKYQTLLVKFVSRSRNISGKVGDLCLQIVSDKLRYMLYLHSEWTMPVILLEHWLNSCKVVQV